MRLRIEPHLERFEVISQLKSLIVEYNKAASSGEYKDGEYSFYDYLYQKSIDPVRRFFYLCISPESLTSDIGNESSTDYETMIDYYSMKFQNLRGTLKVFEYLNSISEILGVTIKDYSYSVEALDVEFGEVRTPDINLFVTTAEEFFKSLLYYQKLVDSYDNFRLDITSEISVNLSVGGTFYSSYTVKEVDNEIQD